MIYTKFPVSQVETISLWLVILVLFFDQSNLAILNFNCQKPQGVFMAQRRGAIININNRNTISHDTLEIMERASPA